jgi:hypothetical protein
VCACACACDESRRENTEVKEEFSRRARGKIKSERVGKKRERGRERERAEEH